jgi:ribosome biogenesis GTPase
VPDLVPSPPADPAPSIPRASAPPASLGWSAAWADTAVAVLVAHPGGRLGRVARVDRAFCLVATGDPAERSPQQVTAPQPTAHQPPGPQPMTHATIADGVSPVTGDWVVLDPGDRVVAVLPRRTTLVRGAGRTDARGQVLAANVDLVGVVHGLSAAPNLARIERYLALAWSSGAQPLVVLSKADLAADPEGDRAETAAATPGVEVVAVSTMPGHPARAGLDRLRDLLPAGTTGTLIGPSGVGKSSLINALLGTDLLLTRDIRADGRGRHTSVTRDLVPLPWGAMLIDTPGLRGVQMWDAEDGLEATFADLVALARECRFNDCQHHGEPGCAVAAAVADGTLSARRLASYEKLLREQEWLAMRYDARLRAEQRAKWKARARAARSRSRP